ncbi:MAG: hypothetical protein L6R36_009385, partial [Xanthoria steineri]
MRTMLGVGRPFDCNRTRVAAKTSAIARRHQDPHCETAPAVHFKEKGNFIARTLALAKRLITLTRELFLSRLEKMEKDDPSPGASQGGTAKVDGPGQEKQTTGSVRLDQRADEPTDIYVIYPQDVTVKSQADAIDEILDRVVVNKTTIYASEVNAHNMWTLFWNATLSESQANMIREDPN